MIYLKRIKYLICFILLLPNWIFAQNFQFSDLKYPFSVKKIQLKENLEIAYVDEGKGSQTLIFIHGLGSYLPAWQLNIKDLQKHFRCIALDLPGYGQSSKGDYAIGMDFYAQTILDLMDKLNLKKVVLVGHSMGGQIALTTALKNSSKIERLILIAPAGLEEFTTQEGQMLLNFTQPNLIAATPDEKIKANLAINFYKMPKIADFMAEDRIKMKQAPDFEAYCQTVSKCVAGMLNEPIFKKLGNIKTKSLLIFGENDALIPNKFLHPQLNTRQVAEYGKSQLPDSQLIMINEAGHFVNFEKAEPVNQAILEFVKK
jgi:pimeloyl-ACP methyl ester carboxylesterase